MDMFYKKLSLYLSENQNISKDDEELYEYAAKVIIHGIINFVITILIGIFFGMLKECVCFFITFFVLRKFTGGIHAKKYINCLSSSRTAPWAWQIACAARRSDWGNISVSIPYLYI